MRSTLSGGPQDQAVHAVGPGDARGTAAPHARPASRAVRAAARRRSRAGASRPRRRPPRSRRRSACTPSRRPAHRAGPRPRPPRAGALERGELADLLGPEPPAGLGPAPQHAEAGARSVEQHAVEPPPANGSAARRRPPSPPPAAAADGRGRRRGASGPDARRPRPRARRRACLGDRGRLAAGGGTDLEDPLPGRRVEHERHRAARLVLGRRPTVANRRQRTEIPGAASPAARRARARRG